MPENEKKRALPLRVLSKIKRIICKLCARARWLVLVLLLALTAEGIMTSYEPILKYTFGIHTGENEFEDLEEIPITSATNFSVNDSGECVIYGNMGHNGMTAIMDIDSLETSYANISNVTLDEEDSSTFTPSNAVITDDNEIYAVKTKMHKTNSSIIASETIVRINSNNEYIGEVCEVKYDTADRIRNSILSRLHYYGGTVTFASVTKYGVKLYSIDTGTQVLTVSDPYPTDENGTYTASVIPIDGAFLFLRSDGNVYRVKSGEPLGESIYRFDITRDKSGFFTQAALAGGKLYVHNENDPTSIYLLENGSLSKAVDISDFETVKNTPVIALDTYRPDEVQGDVLAICLEDRLLTYSDGKVADKNITIKLDRYFTMTLLQIASTISWLCIIGLIINFIIRKKTLLFKQMCITIPLFTAVTVIGAFFASEIFDSIYTDSIGDELQIICGLGSETLEGYDFSSLMSSDENTGAAYRELCERLDKLSAPKKREWSEYYMFSVIYCEPGKDPVLIARNDSLSMPLCNNEDGEFIDKNADKLNDGQTVILKRNFGSYYEDYYNRTEQSELCGYNKINTGNGGGQYYLKVSTDTSQLYGNRAIVLGYVIFVVPALFIIIVSLIVVTSMRISRTIKKATTAVDKMAAGDLSARIKYKSKDELGEICTQVNKMGQSLETLFAEKDKAENFYYKFVPEKFRELLGKENFTDLSLGDASSRELTVLFCDIRSFSINSEIMTAKENFAFVNVIYGKAGPIIRQNNGFVDKYIGDAVMALFENADDAVRCGIELYRAIVLNKNTAAELNVSDINIGIGIHSGMAMIGIVGESERLAGTVISDTVNLSSRLESLTKQYKTAMLISKDTVDRMSDPEALGLRYLGIIQVAGVNEVKAVYEVLDCLPDEQREKRSDNNADLREAIRLFHLGRRNDAADALQAIADSGKSDHVTDMYLEYIKGMSDDDKGNVFRFVRK